MSEQHPGFAQTAEEYCSIVENAETFQRAEFATLCFRLVSKLLKEASELPAAPLIEKVHSIGNEEYSRIVFKLKNVLVDKDYYRMFFDPYEQDVEPIYGSLSDDLADIWRDLKGGFEAYRSGSVEGAIGEWRFAFAHHWGSHHATHALKPLLSLMLEGGWYENEE